MPKKIKDMQPEEKKELYKRYYLNRRAKVITYRQNNNSIGVNDILYKIVNNSEIINMNSFKFLPFLNCITKMIDEIKEPNREPLTKSQEIINMIKSQEDYKKLVDNATTMNIEGLIIEATTKDKPKDRAEPVLIV